MHIDYSQEALDNLRVLPPRFADQIIRKISRLEHGLIGDIKRLQAADFGYRSRSGNYRILFDIVGDRIVIQTIKKRGEAYD
jgi:mRNA-degrading endonuclease RelE of RelBE toxin-antitoxin system